MNEEREGEEEGKRGRGEVKVVDQERVAEEGEIKVDISKETVRDSVGSGIKDEAVRESKGDIVDDGIIITGEAVGSRFKVEVVRKSKGGIFDDEIIITGEDISSDVDSLLDRVTAAV